MTKVIYRPGPGEPDRVTTFGTSFVAGKAAEVTDERALSKLRGNRYFALQGEKTFGDETPSIDPTGADEDAKDRATEERRGKRVTEAARAAEADGRRAVEE